MLKRFIQYYKPHKKLFAMDMTASFFISFIGIIYPIMTRKMLGSYVPDKNIKAIVITGIALFTLYFVRYLLKRFVMYEGHMMGVAMQAQMRRDLFNHLEQLPYSYFDNHETGKLVSRMTNDLFDLSELAHHGPENLITCSITILISFIYLMTINVPLTLVIFACVPFLVFITLSLRSKMRDAFDAARQHMATINASLESSIEGIRVTKAYTNAEKEAQKFEVGNQFFVEASRERYDAMSKFMAGSAFVTDIFNVAVLLAGGVILYLGKLSVADYSAFMLSISIFITPLTTLINFSEQYESGATGFARFLEIMDTPVEKDAPGAKDIDNVSGVISFDHVTYGYAEDENVLRDVSFTINKGEKFALVGPSGGGKTTICHLIPHFYDVTEGRIFIDGRELHEITNDSLRKNIGIVQQDVYLFNASIRDNILYGRLDATEEEVIEAAKRANIHDYVMSLKDGYDTVIGERGVRLSGGQKQRLSIARVFLKNPAILILDEATSALDNSTEILIQEALDELCKGRTTIVVAHRLSTIRNADEIAVISDGKITERGTHEELIKLGGTYNKLYSLQFRNLEGSCC